MLESCRYGTVTERAEAEKVNQSYLCRVQVDAAGPDIVEAILADQRP